MSSSSTSYIVAPNSSATTPYIPNPTQLNGTGALRYIYPQFTGQGSTTTLVQNTSVQTVYTTTESFAAGTYQVQASYYCNGDTAWGATEEMIIEASTVGAAGILFASCGNTFMPAYCSHGDYYIYGSIFGIVSFTGTQSIVIRAQRITPSANTKTVRIDHIIISKIA